MKKDFNINYPMIHQGTEKTEVVFFQVEIILQLDFWYLLSICKLVLYESKSTEDATIIPENFSNSKKS